MGGRFEEVVAVAGQRVSVVGLLMFEDEAARTEGELGFRDARPPAMRLAGNQAHPIALGLAV